MLGVGSSKVKGKREREKKKRKEQTEKHGRGFKSLKSTEYIWSFFLILSFGSSILFFFKF